MKNLTRKLFLSICTLAICAVTLVSTTFAWYTTNTQTTADNLTAATATTGDASIFISRDNKVWNSSVTLSDITSSNLKPLMVGTDGKLVDVDGTEAGTGQYIEFDLYFKTLASSADVSIKLSGITLSNVKNSLDTYKLDNLLNGVANTSNIIVNDENGKYAADVCNALAMTIESTSASLTKQTAYNLDKFNTNKLALQIGQPLDAHAYYEAVSEKTLKPEQKVEYGAYNNDTVFAVLPSAGTSVKVTFRIFLAGNDKQCFDSCKGQEFKISFDFQVIKPAPVTGE